MILTDGNIFKYVRVGAVCSNRAMYGKKVTIDREGKTDYLDMPIAYIDAWWLTYGEKSDEDKD